MVGTYGLWIRNYYCTMLNTYLFIIKYLLRKQKKIYLLIPKNYIRKYFKYVLNKLVFKKIMIKDK